MYCIRSRHVANCDSERLTEVTEAVCVAGSMNEISLTKASSEPPKSWNRTYELAFSLEGAAETHLDDPHWCLLLTSDYPLCPDDPSLRVDRTVDRIDCQDMRTVRVRVFVPHPDDDVCP